MARGWESKDIEAQAEERRAEREAGKREDLPQMTMEELGTAQRRATLELDRTRLTRELDATPHERRRLQLKAAIAHIDMELGKL